MLFINSCIKRFVSTIFANGKIKTRIGSSANPIDISDRKSLDFLYDRAKDIINNIDEFCKRDIYYVPTMQNAFVEKFERPMLNIYIKSNLEESLYEFNAIEEMAKNLCSVSILKIITIHLNLLYYLIQILIRFNLYLNAKMEVACKILALKFIWI